MKRLVILVAFCSAALAIAQTPAVKALPVFDAVVIKPNKEAGNSDGSDSTRSTFKATNLTLKRLLVNAYGIREPLISGLPSWAENEHWDVNAKVSDPDPEVMKSLTKEQRRAMLQAMLIERFHLRAHLEMKVQPIYELTVMSGGPKFKPSAPGEGVGTGIDGSDGRMQLNGTAITLESLAQSLSPSMDRTVMDKTGLAGAWDILLRWTSDRAPQPVPDDAPPAIFTAIEEQLGLKLVPAKGPAPVLVVDHVELPTEN